MDLKEGTNERSTRRHKTSAATDTPRRLRIGLVSTGRRRIAGGLLHRTARFVGATFKEQSLPERPRLRLRPLSASHRGVSETLTGNGT